MMRLFKLSLIPLIGLCGMLAWASSAAADGSTDLPNWAGTLIGTGPSGVILAWILLVAWPQMRKDQREEREAERKLLKEQFDAMRSGNRALHERLDAMMISMGELLGLRRKETEMQP